MGKKRSSLPKNKVVKVFNKYGGKCAYCGKPMEWTAHKPDSFTLDHITPRAEGGTYTMDNLLPACNQCNYMKGTMSLEGFRGALEHFSGVSVRFHMEGPREKRIVWGFEKRFKNS